MYVVISVGTIHNPCLYYRGCFYNRVVNLRSWLREVLLCTHMYTHVHTNG